MTGAVPGGTERTPVEFLALLDLPELPTSEAFLAAAARQMARALALPSSDREGAYALLAADAHLTWACEAALGEGISPSTYPALLGEFLARVPEPGT